MILWAPEERVARSWKKEDIEIDPKMMALDAARAAQDKKGQNLTIIDLQGHSSYTDMLVIATAYSDRQTRAIAEAVQDVLRNERGIRPVHSEGQGPWILLDYGDIVVHVFHEDARAFYALDQLWADAPRVEVPAPSHLGAVVGG
ncbi:MAG: ribosome silencing factor [Myxococcota bacterium]